MVMYYKMEGQDSFCGPLSIEASAQGVQLVPMRTARASGVSTTHLAYQVCSPSGGERRLLLHSAIQVRSVDL